MKKVLWVALIPFVSVGVLVASVVQPFTAAESSRTPHVESLNLIEHIKYLSESLYPRSFEQSRHLSLAADYIEGRFRAMGAATVVQEVVVEESRYKNIIARFGPSAGPLLVIGAHYDSHGDASAGARFPAGYDRSTHTPGADDNASGVAGLIELARLLQQQPPSSPVELVAYTLEEPPHFATGHMGSAWHASALKEQGREVRLMLSLEMIGYFSDEPASQAYPVPGMSMLYPSRGNFLALVGRFENFGVTRKAKALLAGGSDLPIYSINAPGILPGIDFSDHRNYWNKGYPALMLTDTAFYRNPHYHRSGDTYDTLDVTRMAKAVQAVYALAQGF